MRATERDEQTRRARSPSPDDSAPRVVHLRGWPGTGDYRPPRQHVGYVSRLADRPALVMLAAGEDGAEDDRFGLLVVEERAGTAVLRGWLVVPDDLAERDPDALGALTAWASEHPLATTSGPRPRQLLTLSQFFEPYAGPFATVAYGAAGFVVGADLLRLFGLVAEHVVERRGRWAGTWELWLPGWGVRGAKGSVRRRSPHRPALRARARRVGAQVTWGPVEHGNGKAGRDLSRGGFVDVLSAAYALGCGERGYGFSEHRESLGLSPVELPARVHLDAAGCDALVAALDAIGELALVLDERAARWWTDPGERAEGRARLDLVRPESPGELAHQLLARFRVEAPLLKLDLSEDELRAWAETHHGGWCSADERLLGRLVPAEALDLTSAYPAVAHLLGWWVFVTSERVEREDVTAELQALCDRAAVDPTALLDPDAWHRFGLALVSLRPTGDPLPVELRDDERPDGRMVLAPVSSPDRELRYAWADVLAAAVLSGRVPRIGRAVRLVPAGRQAGLRQRLPLLPAAVLDLDEDPAVALVRLRRRARESDPKLADLLRVVANALVYGGFARFDSIWQSDGRRRVLAERPGPWSFLPIASSVTAGSRLVLAILDRLVRDRGGIVVYRDTDSSIVPASPQGGEIELGDGSFVRLLAWHEVDELLARFDALAPFGPAVPVWSVERGSAERPLHAVAFGPKRHAEVILHAGGRVEVVDRTDAGLGGLHADPPTMPGRAGSDDKRAWSLAAVEREVHYLLDPGAGRPAAPWDGAR